MGCTRHSLVMYRIVMYPYTSTHLPYFIPTQLLSVVIVVVGCCCFLSCVQYPLHATSFLFFSFLLIPMHIWPHVVVPGCLVIKTSVVRIGSHALRAGCEHAGGSNGTQASESPQFGVANQRKQRGPRFQKQLLCGG
ncbi:hypothetical protein, unlikely [Trypanosoma congolense IL3000]|uniref:Uncharacterized protein n=1 Tax=Trypanosoma congolense (strain IL3000) TaxID=1068625 RepID=F9W614_TRYCI|nr:hypothetical protein, unlikely [Trypanosoma congolense IL3000]